MNQLLLLLMLLVVVAAAAADAEGLPSVGLGLVQQQEWKLGQVTDEKEEDRKHCRGCLLVLHVAVRQCGVVSSRQQATNYLLHPAQLLVTAIPRLPTCEPRQECHNRVCMPLQHCHWLHCTAAIAVAAVCIMSWPPAVDRLTREWGGGDGNKQTLSAHTPTQCANKGFLLHARHSHSCGVLSPLLIIPPLLTR